MRIGVARPEPAGLRALIPQKESNVMIFTQHRPAAPSAILAGVRQWFPFHPFVPNGYPGIRSYG
jgi:hypothetical protein